MNRRVDGNRHRDRGTDLGLAAALQRSDVSSSLVQTRDRRAGYLRLPACLCSLERRKHPHTVPDPAKCAW